MWESSLPFFTLCGENKSDEEALPHKKTLNACFSMIYTKIFVFNV